MAEQPPPLTPEEEHQVEERSAPKARVVHEAVARQGEEELDRPNRSLFWSGIAAGVAIMTSVWAEAALHLHLPPSPSREAVSGLGYTLGFLIVILGRMQLFTEQTMVPIIPLAKRPNGENFRRVARLWTAVFAGNVIGVAAISALAAYGRVQSPELLAAMIEVSSKLLAESPGQTLLQGIPAGFLVASIAWIRSGANENAFWIVIALTYPIAIGGFTHVIAGAAEAFLLVWTGRADIFWLLTSFLLPALVGNIIGGTGLFAMLAHAQVRNEI